MDFFQAFFYKLVTTIEALDKTKNISYSHIENIKI